MSVSPFDSAVYRGLFGDAETGRLFSDTGEVRAMMLVLGALARVQGEAGVIPEMSGAFLHRATMEAQIDPAALAEATAQNGVSVPGLLAAMRKALEAPEHSAYLHWGATSQDVQDTALMLRLRQAVQIILSRLNEGLQSLGPLAEAEADTPMAARTYGQVAVPSSFGAMVAAWGWPLLRIRERLNTMAEDGFPVSLSGAAGTGAMLGPDPAAIRAGLADALNLRDPGRSWHVDRTPIHELADALSAVTRAGGKLGEDLILLTRTEIAEVALARQGASSTMPQKQNPVGPSVLVALSRFAEGQATVLRQVHREARDGASWFTEWLALPSLVAAAAKSASLIRDLSRDIHPNRLALLARLNDPVGLIHAEAFSFALAAQLGRPEAQAEVKRLAAKAADTGQNLRDVVAAAYPDVALPDAPVLGTAPAEARAFAAACKPQM